jgi:hypothetical protein
MRTRAKRFNLSVPDIATRADTALAAGANDRRRPSRIDATLENYERRSPFLSTLN